ncbi:transporter [Glutamicibacter uratoxydans]|uniref:Transporter n=1 Tax=Glutamicibacter uratoxydans TaxID=43667 RepID=A0A4Y4DRQ6_GLUUR|nr:nucleobase:cation symporter-2 family protein [Glutamicibacter uratoxydans]GED06210.1 transporter [Glutamicibacter uratoxydans]
MSSSRISTAAQQKRGQRPEDERLPMAQNIGFGLQHVLTMYGGIIAPPLIIGTAAGLGEAEIGVLIASCLFVGGLATVLQTVGIPFFGSQLPLVQGVSFAGVATMISILEGGGSIATVFGAVIASSIIGLLITPVFSRIIRFFPPVVAGTVITTIGLTLMPVAAGWTMGGNAKSEDYGSVQNLALAGATLVLVVLFSKVGVAAVSRLSILLAMVVGTIIAAATGMADFSKVLDGPVFAVPQPFAFGMPEFQVAAILSMVIVILVTLTETSADIIAVGEIVGTKTDARRVGDGLRADMISSAISPIFNSFTQSAFAQNVGLVAITGVKSRFVVTAGGGILVILGLLPVLGRFVAAIPTPVLGGAGIVLFGTVAASGIRTLSTVKYEGNMNLVIVAAALGFGMFPIVAPNIYDQFPSWFVTIFHSGISSSAIMAIVLNLLFNHLKIKGNRPQSVMAEASNRRISSAMLGELQEGDYVQDGKLYDSKSNHIPCAD